MAKKIKYLLSLVGITLIFISCKDTHSYTINGDIKKLENAEIYIVTPVDSGHKIDTIQSKGGKFKFKSVSETLEPVVIYMENGKIWITVWAQNGEVIYLTGEANYPELITVKGGEVNELLTAFKTENEEIIKEKSDLRDKISANSEQLDELSTEVTGAHFSSQIKNIEQLLKNRAEDFVEAHPSSIASLVLIQDYILDIGNASKIQPFLSLITEPAKNNKLYTKLQTWSLKDQQTEAGNQAPDFSIVDTKNNAITLETFKDKYLLLTFAASWCTFCESDYPIWLNIRKTFPKDQLELLSISLDENLTEWKNLAEKKEITWTQAIDNAGWASQMVSLYNVSEIPCNYLIDKEGKIIGSKVPTDSLQTILTKLIKTKK